MIAASVAITSALTYHYGWGAIDQGSSEKDYMQWLYIKPWNKFGRYVILAIPQPHAFATYGMNY